jgi:Flp pilus assembly protein TadG
MNEGAAAMAKLRAVIARLRRFVRRRNGNIAVLTGLALIPLVCAAGVAVDTTRAYVVKTQLGSALDAAVLAVGSTISNSNTTLATQLQNYFTANFPMSPLVTSVSVTTVPQNADLTSPTVTAQATATVPMTFMRVVGIDSIPVTVTSQVQKTQGLEVALVLDNTGSMLCGPNDGAPNYSDSACSGGVIATDTTCSNSSNQARICELRNAANQFINTIFNAVTVSDQLYVSVVPYVTTVNVGPALCSGPTSCNGIAMSGSIFTDEFGNWIYTPAGSVSGKTTSGSAVVSSISPGTSSITVGMVVTGTGIPTNTTVASVDSGTQIHLSRSATANGTGITLSLGNPITYDATQSATSTQWIGCVVEPTSTDEMTSGSTALRSTVTDPDQQDPGSPWPQWYALYWKSGSGNSWTASPNTVSYPATLGKVVTDWTAGGGPNNGCPVPLVPLTANKTQIQNTINSMWPRDRGGTQVHIGMIWGWRTLSPNTPFNIGGDYVPTAYNTPGWKKVVILETDGTEEWPDTNQYTGLGRLSDGKINTSTSTSTAVANLDTRLQNVCANMKADGIIIYTIALGSDGASNTTLTQQCPANGGFSVTATNPSGLQAAFDAIAKSLMALRLTQ